MAKNSNSIKKYSPSYNGFLKTSTNMLKGYLTNNENYELSSTDKLISELEEGDITNSMQEYFRFIEFLFDEINTGFRNVIRNDDILINTSFGQINTTFINYDDSRDKLEWVFMEMFRCREDNIDLMPANLCHHQKNQHKFQIYSLSYFNFVP